MKRILLALFCLFLCLTSGVTGQESADPKIFRILAYGKWGFINQAGKTVVVPQFDGAWSSTEGQAAILIGDQWGYMASDGKLTISPSLALPVNLQKD